MREPDSDDLERLLTSLEGISDSLSKISETLQKLSEDVEWGLMMDHGDDTIEH